MKELGDDFKEPGFLLKMGFTRTEEDSTDNYRWVHYSRTFQSDKSTFKFIVRVVYEMSLRDDPEASYEENVSYSFEHVYLLVTDRCMEQLEVHGLTCFDEDSEKPRFVGATKLNIQTRAELKALVKMLS
jgi:hypothetical protein